MDEPDDELRSSRESDAEVLHDDPVATPPPGLDDDTSSGAVIARRQVSSYRAIAQNPNVEAQRDASQPIAANDTSPKQETADAVLKKLTDEVIMAGCIFLTPWLPSGITMSGAGCATPKIPCSHGSSR